MALVRIRHVAGDDIERAHLRDARGFSPPVHRYPAPEQLAEVVRRFWVPVWSLPEGRVTVQRVLQYPVCQVVVGHDYAHLVGPTTGLSTKELSGTGWVVGAMLQPSAGAVLLGAPVSQLRNDVRDLRLVHVIDAEPLIERVRQVMVPDPRDRERQLAATGLLGDALRALLPVDEEGLLVNRIVSYVEERPEVNRVAQVAARFAVSERTLQRLLARRVGLSPKWLIQRRRLHEAAERLRAGGDVDLAGVAHDLGYTDQAHFTRDWRSVTGLTPGRFAAETRESGTSLP